MNIEILKAKQEDALAISIVNAYTWKTRYASIVSEKIINEGGKQIKLTKLVKYMENGEIKTEITKSKI